MTEGLARPGAIARSLLLSTAATITFIACGSNDPDPDTIATAETTFNSAVPEVLRFTAPLVGGGEFEGAAAAGRPVAFWFWAPT